MAFEHARTVTTSAAPEAVWSLWCDPGTWAVWDPAVEHVSLTGAFETGAVGTMMLTGGTEVPVTLEVVEPGSRYLDRLSIGEVVVRIDHVVRALADGAEVTVTTTIEGPGAEDLGAIVTQDGPRAMASLVSMAEGR